MLSRELILKYAIKINDYEHRTDIPLSCPSFHYVANLNSSVNNLDFDKYSGTWYSFATNDPTQPKGLCECDRYKWSYQSDGSYTSELSILCKGLGAFNMKLEGQTNVTGIPGRITEGSPTFGADLIPGYILCVDEDYSATIRYFCTHDYLGVDVFSSIQIWTRTPTSRESMEGRALLEQAHELLSFDEMYLQFSEHVDCDTKLPMVS